MAAKILLVEDKLSALKFAQHALEAKGYEVVTACNGLEGLEKAQKEDIDLLILDIMLPGIDGFELCHRLRAKESKAKLPVLMLTAKPLSSDREAGLKVGANEYLTKPVEPSELLASIERLLAAKGDIDGEIAKTIAFVGTDREVGTSTVAANVAVAMAQMERSVILVDLCPDGGVSQALGLARERTLAEFIEASKAAINRESLGTLLTTHHSGVRVLYGSQDQSSYDRIGPSDVEAALRELGAMAQYVVIDLPVDPSDITGAALRSCDFVTVVVGSAFYPEGGGVLTPGWLAARGYNAGKCGLLLVDKGQLLGPQRPACPKQKTIKVLTIDVLGVVPFDVNACGGEGDQRDVTVLTSPQSMMAVSLAEVTQRLLGMVS
jgi:DNA-binding response OmpR family regulator